MQFFSRYQHLFFSILFTFFLVGIRMIMTGTHTFAFIPWNTFLAIVPLWFSYLLPAARGRVAWLYAALWLLFFPNAMYMVTDLFHLREREKVPYWADLLLLFSAAVNGLIAGFLSLYNTEQWLRQRGSGKRRHLFIVAAMLLCGYGIYLGRYERWNSWDVVAQPFALLSGIADHILHPMRNIDAWMVTGLFGVWMYLLYGFLKTGFRRIR
ncbi:MAG: DUF1361 domain-containing protein [Flavipsychrobacter sp.]|nr:DUF1361 domain-containing protein [Flavipsychrobacter sp.]